MSFCNSTTVDENPQDIRERNNTFYKVFHNHGGEETNWISVLILKFYVYKLGEITGLQYKNTLSHISKHVRKLTTSKHGILPTTYRYSTTAFFFLSIVSSCNTSTSLYNTVI